MVVVSHIVTLISHFTWKRKCDLTAVSSRTFYFLGLTVVICAYRFSPINTVVYLR